jgi:hypothetical protein
MSEAYPLRWPDGWPKRPGYMGGGPFKGLTPEKALNSLRHELRLLGAQNVVISSNLRPRNYIVVARADARSQPGIALYFMLKARAMTMAQDVYSSPYANMRSLALAIEAMRQLERHGGGHMMQRAFGGFAQLPPPKGQQATPRRPWRVVLGMESIDKSLIAEFQRPIAEDRYRKLSRERHPDAASGSHEAMAELNIAITEAREELK